MTISESEANARLAKLRKREVTGADFDRLRRLGATKVTLSRLLELMQQQLDRDCPGE